MKTKMKKVKKELKAKKELKQLLKEQKRKKDLLTNKNFYLKIYKKHPIIRDAFFIFTAETVMECYHFLKTFLAQNKNHLILKATP